MLTVRIQSPSQGTKRMTLSSSDKINTFLDKIQKEFGLGDIGWSLYKEHDKKEEIRTSRSKSLSSYNIRHGDMLFLLEDTNKNRFDHVPTESGYSSSESVKSGLPPDVAVIEDRVDQVLEKMDGRIERSRNEQLCRHGPSGKCFNCVPLEPFDEAYLKNADPPIKFLSFHSYIRKLTAGVDKGKFAILENLSCKVKSGCTSHLPWPEGICTKCQPNAVTLNRQKYRHIDNVMFENPFLVERFLNYWRTSGNQRIGFLYGKYEVHKDIPLGIKATVAAIYEPPQIGATNSIELLDDDKQHIVNQVANRLGLQKVGWIFTDLVPQDLTKGTVKHCRGNIDSHFLSAEECIMAGNYQNRHPNPCKLSPDGHFGSKFATVVVTGDKDNQIHFEGYQVSDQCMALVQDDCLVPTTDVPELGYVKESSNEQYVPDVFYKYKDQYGNEVSQLGRPLPVEYLLVDFTAAFPKEPLFTFKAGSVNKPFPLENRAAVGEVQDFNAFSAYMQQFQLEDYFKALSDFHVLIYLASCDMLPLKDKLGPLLESLKTDDEGIFHQWSKSEEWATVEQLLQAHAPSPPPRESSFVGPHAAPLPPIGANASQMWICKHCTFHNTVIGANCEMCGLPQV